MLPGLRPHIAAALAGVTVLAACTSGSGEAPTPAATGTHHRGGSSLSTATRPAGSPARPPGEFTVSFAGDVHFSGRVRARLDRDPATAFAQAARGLRAADLTMVNLETAITTGGVQQNKLFTFRAPPTAFTALRDAGIDVATMANNHGADYGTPGLRDTLAAIKSSGFPVIGVGRNAAQAYAPYTTTLHGVPVAIIAADQVHDETTLSLFSAGHGLFSKTSIQTANTATCT